MIRKYFFLFSHYYNYQRGVPGSQQVDRIIRLAYLFSIVHLTNLILSRSTPSYLHLAVSEGANEIVRDLIKITPHPCLLDIQNDHLQSSLHLAVLSGNVHLVRMLLLAGAEVSVTD